MRILLATDGSEYSIEAAKKCCEFIAESEIDEIKLITVVDNFTPMATEPFISPEEFMATVEKELREDAEKIIDDTEKTLVESNDKINFEKEILMGSPGKVIIKEAEEWKADLIIVGSHGQGFWGRALLGSVSDAVVHHAPCSVFVIKKQDNKKI